MGEYKVRVSFTMSIKADDVKEAKRIAANTYRNTNNVYGLHFMTLNSTEIDKWDSDMSDPMGYDDPYDEIDEVTEEGWNGEL